MSYFHCRNGNHIDCNGYVGPLDSFTCQCEHEGCHKGARFECACGFWREYEGRAPSPEAITAIHASARPYCDRFVATEASR